MQRFTRHLIGWMLLLLAGCHPGLLKSDDPVSRAPAGPSAIPPSIKLYVFRDYPILAMPYSQAVEGGADRLVTLPNLVFLVVHPKGLTLIDSGYGRRFPEIRRTFPFNFFYALYPVGTSATYHLASEQMAAMGFRPRQVSRLILTHLHTDHAGGVVDFPQATVIVNRTEWDGHPRLASFVKRRIQSHGELVDLSSGPAYETFRHSRDLFGDGSVVLVPTPGHTRGHMSVFVNLASGKRFFLAGDVAWVRENYVRPARKGWVTRHLLEPGWTDDSLARVHELYDLAPDVTIVPSHDPACDRDLLQPPACYQ